MAAIKSLRFALLSNNVNYCYCQQHGTWVLYQSTVILWCIARVRAFLHLHCVVMTKALFQYPIRSLEDLSLNFSNHSEIWQAPQQHYCWDAYQISEQLDNSKNKSRDFARSYHKTSKRILKWGPGRQQSKHGIFVDLSRETFHDYGWKFNTKRVQNSKW